MTLYAWLASCAACFLVPAVYAVRATLAASEARGLAGVATVEREKAERAAAAYQAEAQALREQNARLVKTSDAVAGENEKLRRIVAANATPAETVAALNAAFR